MSIVPALSKSWVQILALTLPQQVILTSRSCPSLCSEVKVRQLGMISQKGSLYLDSPTHNLWVLVLCNSLPSRISRDDCYLVHYYGQGSVPV